SAEAWVPIQDDTPEMDGRSARYWYAFGRLRPGQSVETADAETKAIAAHLATAYPTQDGNWRVRLTALRTSLTQRYRRAMLALMAAVGFVLLIVCASLAGLMLARTSTRQREVLVRLALGASRRRLVRQFLIEGFLLTLAGAVIGIAFTRWSVDGLFVLLPSTSFGALSALRGDVRINESVFLFASVVSFMAAVLFAVIPAVSSMRTARTNSS